MRRDRKAGSTRRDGVPARMRPGLYVDGVTPTSRHWPMAMHSIHHDADRTRPAAKAPKRGPATDGGHRRARRPRLPRPARRRATNDNTPGIHIGVGLTDTPSLYVDGVRCPNDPVTGMLTPTTPLGDGASITTTLTDAAGNEKSARPLPLTVDTAASCRPWRDPDQLAAPSTNDNGAPGIHIGVGLRHAEPLYVVDGVKGGGGDRRSWQRDADRRHWAMAPQFTTGRPTRPATKSPKARPATDGRHRRARRPAALTSTAPSTNDNTRASISGVGLTDTPSLYVDGVKVPATYDPVTGTLT